jgi:hypothetical protein
MTSRHGIFRLTATAPNAARAVPACSKQMRAAGVLAVNRGGCERLNPSFWNSRLHGEETLSDPRVEENATRAAARLPRLDIEIIQLSRQLAP